MIRRLLACLVTLSFARAGFAGPIRDSIARAIEPVQISGWRHLSGNATIVNGVAMTGAAPTVVVLANRSMKDETVIGSPDAVSSCGCGSGPKVGALVLPWGLRRSRGGVALTIRGTDISIQRDGFKVSKSMSILFGQLRGY
jgi:hypothetical protein